MKLYIGQSDDTERILKIGYTERTCWARCSHEDYTIFCAVELDISMPETLFIESYLRMALNAMTETLRQIRTDYVVMKDNVWENVVEWGGKWFLTFVKEALEIVNTKRQFSNTPPVTIAQKFNYWVMPYSY